MIASDVSIVSNLVYSRYICLFSLSLCVFLSLYRKRACEHYRDVLGLLPPMIVSDVSVVDTYGLCLSFFFSFSPSLESGHVNIIETYREFVVPSAPEVVVPSASRIEERVLDLLMYRNGTVFCTQCNGPHDPSYFHLTPEARVENLVRSLRI